MKKAFTIFLVCLSLSQLLCAIEYASIEEISLKKDSQKKIFVKYGDNVKLFKFRWTLYVNEGLVILRSYDTIVAQNILYLNHTNQSFVLYLKGKVSSTYMAPYLLVKFKKFNYKKNEAVFELFLYDKKSQIQMEYLKNDE